MVTFVIGIVLARLLGPEEFGLIGMIMVFTEISQIFINGGIKDALIRRKTVADIEYQTAFWFNLTVGLICYGLLFVAAPWIADFYQMPILTSLIRVISIGLLFNAFYMVQEVQVIKALRFKHLMVVGLLSSVISGAIGIGLALSDFGVWSLVWRNVILSVAMFMLLSFVTRWQPRIRFSMSSLKELFSFGSRLMVLGVINTISNNITYLVIGKKYTAADLGQFTRADTFYKLPTLTISQTIERVTYPILAQYQEDKTRLSTVYRRLLNPIFMVTAMVLFTLSLSAPEMVQILLGDEWKQSGEFLRILCFAGMFYPLDSLNTNILKVLNNSQEVLRIGLLRKISIAATVVILLLFGIEAYLYSYIVHRFVAYAMISRLSERLIGYGIRKQLKDVAPIALVMGIIYTVILLGLKMQIENVWLNLIVTSLLMIGSSYALLTIFKFRAVGEVNEIVLKKLRKN